CACWWAFSRDVDVRHLHSFPTRRSSDLLHPWMAKLRAAMIEARRGLKVFRNPRLGAWAAFMQLLAWAIQWFACYTLLVALGLDQDRKSTRLNSSHEWISYAVFCLKKKNS